MPSPCAILTLDTTNFENENLIAEILKIKDWEGKTPVSHAGKKIEQKDKEMGNRKKM